MNIELHDGESLAATFSETGDLLSFLSGGARWTLRHPAPCCGLVFVPPPGKALPLPETNDSPAANDTPPFPDRSVFRPEAGSGRILRADARSLEVVYSTSKDSDGTVIDAPIRISWRLSEGLLQGQAHLESLAANHVLHALIFPHFSLPVSRDGALIRPSIGGVVQPDAGQRLLDTGGTIRLLYPGQMSMQCFGWREPSRGLYIDSRDTKGWSKIWQLTGEGDGVAFQAWHPVPRQERPQGGFSLPYRISLGGFDGTWFDVGRIYRKWALDTPRASRGPEQRRESYIGELACWVWNRGRIENVCPPVKELARRLDLPVALDWYWWHKHGYDTEYPDYFPPREGTAAFMDAVRDLRRNHVVTQVYTNGIGYDMDGGTWLPDGPECAILKENGEFKAHAYNTYTGHRLAHCCGASARWREKLEAVVRQAHALGLDGLYIDMIPNVIGVDPCFHPHHDHAPGGGTYQVDGFRALWSKLRQTYPGFVFTTEAPSECLMDLVDAFITITTSNERLGSPYEPIQLWNAVYHGRAVCFGNYALLDGIPPFDELWPQEFRHSPEQERDWRTLCPDQFAIELARTLIGGVQPMVANLRMSHFEDPAYGPDIDFLLHVCRFYHAHREWLLWGDMLPPGVLSCDPVEMRFLQRMIFTAAGSENILTKSEPGVLHSAWRSPAGEPLAVLVNYTRETQTARFRPAPGFRVATPLPTGFRTVNEGMVEGELPRRSCIALALA